MQLAANGAKVLSKQQLVWPSSSTDFIFGAPVISSSFRRKGLSVNPPLATSLAPRPPAISVSFLNTPPIISPVQELIICTSVITLHNVTIYKVTIYICSHFGTCYCSSCSFMKIPTIRSTASCLVCLGGRVSCVSASSVDVGFGSL